MINLKVFDVEHGSSNLLTTPYNKRILIDAGSSGEFSPAKYIHENFGQNGLYWLSISHFDSDHLMDISNIVEFCPPTVLGVPEVRPDQLESLYLGAFSTPLEVLRTFKASMPTVLPPIDDPYYNWGYGIQLYAFQNKFEDLINPKMNDMSVVIFAVYKGWTLVFPGDLEVAGWKRLLQNPEFVTLLSQTNILIASHHGRENGYCDEVFNYAKPLLTIISDREVGSTSCTDKYYQKSSGCMVMDGNYNEQIRYVLTTRQDGAIDLTIEDDGILFIKTER